MINKLCYEFFREFARYEYCLKAAGFLCDKRVAQVNWDRYAMEVTHVFDSPEDTALKAAIEYFLEFPPKKQIVKDGMLAWDNTPLEEKIIAKKILILIRRVRNNLFHGGKFNGEWFEPERSEVLMRHGLTIMEACRKSHPTVDEAYTGIVP